MKKLWWIIGACVLIGLVVFFMSRGQSSDQTIETSLVSYETVTQDISFTGRLQPINEVALGFEYGGTLTALPVAAGQTVTAGTVLAYLDDQAAQLELAQANANQASTTEQALLAWRQAEEDWNNTKTTNAQALETKRQTVRDTKKALDQQKELYLQILREYDEYSSTAKTAYAAVLTAESAYHAAQETLAQSEKTISQSNETASHAVDLAAAQYQATLQAASNTSGLSSLSAARSLAEVKLSKSILRAPFDGTVTAIDNEIGEIITATVPVMTFADLTNLEISAMVPETDAASLAANQSATITFDALPINQEYSAEITYISPSATLTEGVPTYEVKLKLPNQPSELKAGFTANIEVHVAEHSHTLAIPRRAIHTDNTGTYVYVLENNVPVSHSVTIGLYGSNGLAEVTSGLNENDPLVIDPDVNTP